MTIATPFTDSYDKAFLLETMMGPNAMRVAEELASFLPLREGMRVLDLGCGMGISSILLARKFGVTVFAADLWITPTDNFRRFEALGLGERIVPLSVDATRELPFAEGYFDVLFSVDAYHYFGADEAVLPRLLPLVRPGGHVAVAVPGLLRELPGGEVPEELRPFWVPEMNDQFHSLPWWRALWERAAGLRLGPCREMDCLRRAWDDWLESPNPYARQDVPMMQAEGGKYFSLVQLCGQRI
ncbi:methyltransferase domain-containing protein [Desulfocurvus sp.]|uniref:SAM-dependent methyltransferase n=1 Tax=Desulfocurvus sp. TaxID=2871698 RepID=UPI0025C3E378|nr:methyltransferase domain-containing protein [Desulfocurvus sp.]MCK9239696.1 methyltransferase domain-containing protein [Desulfocurvus sp.]